MDLPPGGVYRPRKSEEPAVLEREDFQTLLDALARRGYRVIGPTVAEGAVIYDEVASPGHLPVGWADEQDGGTYRLKKRPDLALFGYVLGPHSWKSFLHTPRAKMWEATRRRGFTLVREDRKNPPRAFLGVRPCELQAIAIQDRILLSGDYTDPDYRSVRENVALIAVNCVQPGGTCFCSSMGTGPKATDGFDLALTEVIERSRHYFLLEVGTELGGHILREIPSRPATGGERETGKRLLATAATTMGRFLNTAGLHDLLVQNPEHPRWDDVARRCLTCGNCTMVCPTCFCSTVEDLTDLSGAHAERWRRWDSCFTLDFSFIHGGSVRSTPRARYRQWMTHKLAYWIDQFGMSGCVGCGRCITWCPVGIDLTEETQAIRERAPKTITAVPTY